MPWLKLRVVVLTEDAEMELEEARHQFARFDDAWDGITWLLARNPTPVESFTTTWNGQEFVLYGFEGDLAAKIPNMWLVYQYDDEQVTIHGINAMTASEPV